jgi:hypothetical protein
VVEGGSRTGFAHQAGPSLRIGREFRRQNLDGNLAAEPHVLGSVNDSHAASPNLLEQPIIADRRERRGRFHWRNEAVTFLRKRFNVARICCGIPECFAQALHGGVDAVLELDNRAIRPEPFLDRFSAHQSGGLYHQHGQDLERLVGCAHADAALA